MTTPEELAEALVWNPLMYVLVALVAAFALLIYLANDLLMHCAESTRIARMDDEEYDRWVRRRRA